MLNNKTIAVVLPAYNAAATLERTLADVPSEIVDIRILVDDRSSDATVQVAQKVENLIVVAHRRNVGYGGNQKTCYEEALKCGADIVVMLHPDYQYTPKLVPAMAAMIAWGEYDVVLGSRILGKGALRGGMPMYKYLFNRVLTLIQNILLQQKYSEYHTGFRAFSRTVLETLPLEENSNNFVFDNEMLAQVEYFGFRVGEVSCPTRYADDSSSIRFWPSVRYGFGVLSVSIKFFLQKRLGYSFAIFNKSGRKLVPPA